MKNGLLIVGAGLAAQRCAQTLRGGGFEDPITIVGDELELPYDRPPLSKALLAGEVEKPQIRFREPGWYAQNSIDMLLGTRAAALDPVTRRVVLADGRWLEYDALLIATGAAARSLPQLAGYANCRPLRTIDDARRLRQALAPGLKLAIIGAGFIGQEVAATASAAGAEVTVVEAQPLPLAGPFGEAVGRWVVDLHTGQGVRMLLDSRLAGARGNGRVEELILDNGVRVACDAVVVGIGVVPAAAWLAGSGLDVDGVRTDPQGRTAIPGIYAAGDVARSFDHRIGGYARSEHWDAASRQGIAVARAILAEPPSAPALPSFWSDQYGLRLQYVGHAASANRISVDGELDENDFTVVYRRGHRPVAALSVGRPSQLAALRRQIEGGGERDPSTRAKEMVG
jgi:NADPH-dependent 2,4-dienoyl-CoA reductase/sulfur reductase-like enzyme